jgi:hypothetical protein
MIVVSYVRVCVCIFLQQCAYIFGVMCIFVIYKCLS